MRRFLSFVLIFLILISLVGCGNSISDHTNFYYCNIDYQFGESASVIVSESRDISGHEGELSYLISLYLTGPSSKKLESPFPKSTKLISAQVENNCVLIELSYLNRQLTDVEFILACACLSLSVMEFTEAEEVSITSGEKTISMDKNDLLLYDTITAEATTEVEK